MSRPLDAAKAVISLVRLIRDPNRLGEVFALADHMLAASPPERRAAIVASFRDLPDAHRVFADKPRLGAIDLDALAKLPKGTLGQVFAQHMRDNGLDPSAIPTIPSRTDLEFLHAHLYETHDVWHAVTGFTTDVAGELGLQAFYLAQTPGGLPPVILAGGLVNTLLFAMDQRNVRMREIVRGWLLGQRAKPFFGVRWSELWAVPLDEVRRRLGVDLGAVERAMPEAAPPLSHAA
jgi:ubiquinone biosynthesis protein Coq4